MTHIQIMRQLARQLQFIGVANATIQFFDPSKYERFRNVLAYEEAANTVTYQHAIREFPEDVEMGIPPSLTFTIAGSVLTFLHP